MRYAVVLICALSLAARGEAGRCVYSDSSWQKLRVSQRKAALETAQLSMLDGRCFALLLKRVAQGREGDASEAVLSLVGRYCSTNASFSTSLFIEILGAVPADRAPGLAAGLLAKWSEANGRVRDVLDGLEEGGAYREMDSVYVLCDLAGGLDIYDLLKWASVRGVLGDYAGAARVFCAVSLREPRLWAMARSQFVQQLSEAEPGVRAPALHEFYACCREGSIADTARLLEWLSDTYAHFGLYAEETASIEAGVGDPVERARRLLDVARGRFGQRLFEHAIAPALAAYQSLPDGPARSECAALLYQSYVAVQRSDSALVWFRKAGVSDMQSMTSAAVLYQQAGLLAQSDSLIASLPPSITRDTLEIRQCIFEGAIEKARSLTLERSVMRHWAKASADASLWRVRTAVYAGDLAAALNDIDSAHFAPSWHAAREMLEHKYAAQIFRTSPEAYGAWGRLERALCIGAVQVLADSLDTQGLAGAARELYDVTLAQALIDKHFYAKAVKVLSREGAAGAAPRAQYFLAEALIMQGDIDRAKAILERLMLEHPQDVFSSRARIYLLGLDQKVRM